MKPQELSRWRKEQRFTQWELGQKLGVTKTTIYRWEKAMREIPPFLHLALRCLESEGGEINTKGKTYYAVIALNGKRKWFKGGPAKKDAQKVLNDK